MGWVSGDRPLDWWEIAIQYALMFWAVGFLFVIPHVISDVWWAKFATVWLFAPVVIALTPLLFAAAWNRKWNFAVLFVLMVWSGVVGGLVVMWRSLNG